MPSTHLYLATRNRHKGRELAELLGTEYFVEDLSQHPEIPDVEESGTTFAANAALKAISVSRHLPGLVLADDSGLEVDSLGGAPGVYSARYAGHGATDSENRQKLLAALPAPESQASRVARFRCVLVLARAGQALATLEGVIEGHVLEKERGAMGFGYDAIFRPTGFERTFAELNATEKNAISHRAVAVAKLREFLQARDLPGE